MRSLAQERITPVLRRAPAPAARRCACGGETGPDGECASCRRARLARQAPAAPAQSFAATPIHAADRAEGGLAGITALAGLLRRRDPGVPLDAATRGTMGARLGTDLAGTRLHAGPASQAAGRLLGTRAFTIGRDVYLGERAAPRPMHGRDPVLEHELMHAAQQRPWTGQRLNVAPAGGVHEAEAARFAASPLGGGQAKATASPPAMMGLHPAIYALIAGELACMFGFYFYALTSLGRRSDKYMHCWTSCKIATYCPPVPLASQVVTAIIGALKELSDVVLGESEMRDMKNNLSGIECSLHYLTSCDSCCAAKEAAGALATAEPPSREEDSLDGAAAEAVSRDVLPEEGTA